MHLCIYLADYKLHLRLHVSVPESLWIHLAYATAAVGICVVSLMDVSVLSHTTIALWDSTSIAPSDSEQAQTSICTHTCFVSCSLFFLINLKQSPSCLCHVSLMLLIIVGGGVAVCRASANRFQKAYVFAKDIWHMFYSNACIVMWYSFRISFGESLCPLIYWCNLLW